MSDPLEPEQGVLGEPPAPPRAVWSAALARALDPDAERIDAADLVPDQADFVTPADPAADDTDWWLDPSGQLTEDVIEDHDVAHPPSPDPWLPGSEPETY
ncbi:hypothetical protein Aca07nite_59820 [Actinoplanes capillaceus]|uniref:Uncharacterized protein n=1 Tax=Actinoplanes campanulatus TaxID=113559 RepID=A0ABQ3WR84_9ACTN|nr:hypothetical protein [Actinoplanes capillaceus]GID48707.1 hypothetical protein Aca07nite_59820 [Actinoplanes capillaceus]